VTATIMGDDAVVRRVFTVDVEQAAGGDARPSTKRPENSEHPPTSTMIDVTRLSHPDFLIEIDLVAITEA
jgi:enamine deaminase RidA (YjgF/YER057c/UK114 family)